MVVYFSIDLFGQLRCGWVVSPPNKWWNEWNRFFIQFHNRRWLVARQHWLNPNTDDGRAKSNYLFFIMGTSRHQVGGVHKRNIYCKQTSNKSQKPNCIILVATEMRTKRSTWSNKVCFAVSLITFAETTTRNGVGKMADQSLLRQ